MDLLIHSDVFIAYFNSILKGDKNEVELLISQIFNNNHNQILFNLKLNEFIRTGLGVSHPLDDFYKVFIQQLINSRILSVQSLNDNNSEIDDELENINKRYTNEIHSTKKHGLYGKICLVHSARLDAIAFRSFSLISKPNNHWFIINMAAINPTGLTVRYFDFKSDKEINSYIENIYESATDIEFVNIFDRNLNLDHKLFDWFVGRSRVEYLTQKYSNEQIRDLSSKLKSKFRRIQIYTTNKQQIHERRILFKGLIIEIDNDFWDLTIKNTTWKIDTFCCNSLSDLFFKKKKVYFDLRY